MITTMAKTLIFVGGILMIAGVVLLALGKIPGVGKLPGDILIKKDNFTFYFPLTTSILLSLLVSFLLFLWNQK